MNRSNEKAEWLKMKRFDNGGEQQSGSFPGEIHCKKYLKHSQVTDEIIEHHFRHKILTAKFNCI